MQHCLKCRGSMRLDWEFPGIVCQRCGVVYYFQKPIVEILDRVMNQRKSREGWHQPAKLSA